MALKILVCVKQVPDTAEIKIDPETNNLIRSGVPSIVNPFDLFALEMALRARDAAGGNDGSGGIVTALSMGPEQAEAALRDCLARGADRAVLLTDKRFAGSDTLATSYILSRAVERLGPFDLILCGKQAIDGDTAQVGPELAERLELPQISGVFDLSLEDHTVRAKRESETGYDLLEVALPALLTVMKTEYEPSLPSLRGRLSAAKKPVERLCAADLGVEMARVGLAGSPTRVIRTYVPRCAKRVVMLEGEADEAAASLIGALFEKDLLRGGGS